MSAVREQGSLPTPLRDARAWEKNVYEAEVGAKAGTALAEEIGKSFSGHERNKMFFSCQGKDFKDVSAISGLDNPSDGRVLSLWDYDRDGRQDFAVVNANAPLLNLYRNEVPAPGKVVAVRFVGGNKASTAAQSWGNRDGYGAKVKVKAGKLELRREFRCGEGMAAQNSTTLLIGIGDHDRANSVVVKWPSGAEQEVRDVEAGTVLTFHENPAESVSLPPGSRPSGTAGVSGGSYLLPPSRQVPSPLKPLTDLVFPKLNGVNEGAKGLRLYTTMATWCAACKSYLPELRQLRESFDPESLGMYGLPVDETDDAKKLKDYRAEYTPPYLLLSETTQPQKVALKRLLYDVNALQGLPSTVVTDSRGRVLLSTPGLPSVSQLRALPSLP